MIRPQLELGNRQRVTLDLDAEAARVVGRLISLITVGVAECPQTPGLGQFPRLAPCSAAL